MIRSISKNQLLMIVLAVGFFVGIIYENYVQSIHFFEKEQLCLLYDLNVETKEYFLYIFKIRFLTMIGLWWIGSFRWRKILILLIFGWSGFFFGRILVSAILANGVRGIFIGIAAFFPHMLFYLCAFLIVLLHAYEERKRNWKKKQIAVIILIFVLGICSEVYVNPIILKLVIKQF